MTKPGFVAPTTPGWWVRNNRVGTNKTEYNWDITAVGGRDSLGTASGSYGWNVSVAGTSGVTFVGANAANDTSVPLPPHAVGDEIIIFARTSGGALPVKPAAGGTVPAWADIDSSAVNFFANVVTVQFVATATNHTSGVWGGGTDGLIAVVVTEVNATTPVGGHAVGTTNSVAGIGSAPAVTMTMTDDTSLLLYFYGWGDGSNPITAIGPAPAGYTQRVAATYSGLVGLCLNTKDVTTSDGAVDQNATNSTWNNGATIEILGIQ
jgi:hypothetical protein